MDNDPAIRWLYPTSTARKAHAFLAFSEEGNDKQRGIQSLCGDYGRWRYDRGFVTPDGGFPSDGCRRCADAAWKIISEARGK